MRVRDSRIGRLTALAALTAGALALSGCATVSVSSSRYLGMPVAAPTDPAGVEILRREPRRRHVQIGEVILRPSGDPEVAKLERALREEAAALGADAAVVVRDTTRRMGSFVSGPWWSRSHTPVYGRVIVAVAIRYP